MFGPSLSIAGYASAAGATLAPHTARHMPATTHASPLTNGHSLASAVSCRGVTKEFGGQGTKTLALRGVDLEVQDAQLTLLVGPSGCGKTTLISIVAGLLNPTLGRVAVLGSDL